MMEMVINGVSTRKVELITEELCGKKFSKSTISELCKNLDPIVEAFRTRPLQSYYPFVMVDAIYVKAVSYTHLYSNNKLNLEKMLLQFLAEEDPMLSMLKWLCEQLMEVEVAAKINASKSEHNPQRTGYRSGYRVRRFDTRLGTMYLFVPKIRKGGYIPFFVTEKKRSEVALMNVIQEAYINGVSTRKIEKLAKSLGIDSISRSQVSQITKELNDQVAAFRQRPLQETYPVLWVDSLYEKIRVGHQVKNLAVAVVVGIDENGKRDILAIEPMYEESETTYQNLFENLKERGLKNTWLVVSDAHKGLVKAIQKSFVGCSWQRCKVHFMRNILAHVPAKSKLEFAKKLKQIWLQPDLESARAYAHSIMDTYEHQYHAGTSAIRIIISLLMRCV